MEIRSILFKNIMKKLSVNVATSGSVAGFRIHKSLVNRTSCRDVQRVPNAWFANIKTNRLIIAAINPPPNKILGILSYLFVKIKINMPTMNSRVIIHKT